jgi:D-xylulose 5-phosphate/D-fructose 6-phosphate phosphoketolase
MVRTDPSALSGTTVARNRQKRQSTPGCSTSTPSGSKITARLPWRGKIASLNYLLASHVWQQDHNGFTHQDAGFLELAAQADPAELALTVMTALQGGLLMAQATRALTARQELPRNLAVLHSPLLRAVAVRCRARTMRSPTGELGFAGHCRHAEAEMRALGADTATRITDSPALAELLRPAGHQP